MLSFPNCKINLGLNVVSKRADGYHNLETVFYPIAIKDALEIVHAEQLSVTITGLEIAGGQENNLCYKAYQLLKRDFPALPAIAIHLHKAIPMGAGLGGGSADGAFMLQLLNKKFNLNIPVKQLLDYALQLGSDCPFFIVNKPCYAESRGEILTPVEVDLSPYTIYIINPGIHVSTKEAFSQLTPKKPSVNIRDIISMPVNRWRDNLKNDFEEPVFAAYPEISNIKQALYDAGAMYASMTGTGSTVYGLFPKGSEISFSFPSHYFSRVL